MNKNRTWSMTYIRFMIDRDMSQVMAIEESCFEVAWTREDFKNALHGRHCSVLVAETTHDGHDRIAGFIVYEFRKKCFEILNMAVDPWLWRQGIGSRMIEKLRDKMTRERTAIRCTLNERNVRAQLFLKACGFRATEVKRRFFIESDSDAILMEYRA